MCQRQQAILFERHVFGSSTDTRADGAAVIYHTVPQPRDFATTLVLLLLLLYSCTTGRTRMMRSSKLTDTSGSSAIFTVCVNT